jgi:hypothetical protein
MLYGAPPRGDPRLGLRAVARKRPVHKGKANVPSDLDFEAEFEWVHTVWKGTVFCYHPVAITYAIY